MSTVLVAYLRGIPVSVCEDDVRKAEQYRLLAKTETRLLFKSGVQKARPLQIFWDRFYTISFMRTRHRIRFHLGAISKHNKGTYEAQKPECLAALRE